MGDELSIHAVVTSKDCALPTHNTTTCETFIADPELVHLDFSHTKSFLLALTLVNKIEILPLLLMFKSTSEIYFCTLNASIPKSNKETLDLLKRILLLY